MNTSYNYADFIGLNLDADLDQGHGDHEIKAVTQTDDKAQPLHTSVIDDNEKSLKINL
ncbi:MAG: hypothetical protein OEY43_06735 [Gammaproteobacteria bacterium]|nr:hypothetical protein [Gammaproteobacteria bacterium]